MSLTKVCDHWIDLSEIKKVGSMEQGEEGEYYTIFMRNGEKLLVFENFETAHPNFWHFPREELLKMIKEG